MPLIIVGDWKNVYIPASISKIDGFSFSWDKSLSQIYVAAAEPPTCTRDPFDFVEKSVCELYVSEGSLEDYKSAEVWKEFYTIKTFDPSTFNPESISTGVRNVKTDATKTIIAIYNLNGVRLSSLQQGLNLVI